MKILIIRLSSFGDILQAQPCLTALLAPSSQLSTVPSIDWLVRSDMASLLQKQPLRRVFSLERKRGFFGLLSLINDLSRENYSHIYDAHNNVRSFFIRWLLPLLTFFRHGTWPRVLVRSKKRWKRFLFFKLRRPVFTLPYRGSHSFLEPLKKWGVNTAFLQQPHWKINTTLTIPLPEKYIAIAPSAAWPTKRWPVDSWKELIQLLPSWHFVILGGPEDVFCADIATIAPSRVMNLAGKLSLLESCAVVANANLTISGDTGLLHAADQLRRPNIGLIGPTAFGYTSQNTSSILETELYCKPCSKDGRDRCINPIFQKCMKEITPALVAQNVRTFEARL